MPQKINPEISATDEVMRGSNTKAGKIVIKEKKRRWLETSCLSRYLFRSSGITPNRMATAINNKAVFCDPKASIEISPALIRIQKRRKRDNRLA